MPDLPRYVEKDAVVEVGLSRETLDFLLGYLPQTIQFTRELWTLERQTEPHQETLVDA